MVVYTPPAETEEQPNFKAIYFGNEFPTDDLSNLLRRLHNHSKQRGHVVLARFLNKATRALRNEVSQLRAGLAELVPSFESVTTLAGETELCQQYRSYVKMTPTEADPSVYLGDVYVFQDGVIMGMVGGMQFRRYPRILMNRFFAAPDSLVAMSYAAASSSILAVPAPAPAPAVSQAKSTVPGVAEPLAPCPAPAPAPSTIYAPTPAALVDSDTTSGKALALIAKEGGLDLSDLVDDAAFANLGVDSLMSLVIAEKFREQLSIVVAGSFLLEYPTVGALRSWLEEYFS
ncbi:ketoacyl-synt-domain-containing protein [Penicillium freii]|uniref:Carrier domain-containing protein n=1 Tax=Penicillium freii TaxID=48697 RepID=A0A117NRV7_PENFR|nr:ketoacyl-synt-domain-containing protein [Penicillium freii]KUM66172.1 hypothetical protein ACN42_g920 [Penicillium freii]